MTDERHRLAALLVDALHDPGSEYDYADRLIAAGVRATTAQPPDALRDALAAVEDIARHRTGDSAWHDVRVIVRAALASPQPEAPVALRGLTIAPIQHDDPLCRKDGCDCWCRACERHNWRHERTPAEPSGVQPTLPVGAVVASALMAANYGGDSGEDVDRFLAELAKRGYSVGPSQPEAQVALDVERLARALREAWTDGHRDGEAWDSRAAAIAREYSKP